MNDLERLHQYDLSTILDVGQLVTLRMMGGKFSGTITIIEPPYGLMSPRYKVKLSDGKTTGWLYKSDFL